MGLDTIMLVFGVTSACLDAEYAGNESWDPAVGPFDGWVLHEQRFSQRVQLLIPYPNKHPLRQRYRPILLYPGPLLQQLSLHPAKTLLYLSPY